MNKENERDNIRKNEHKRLNKSKAIKISLSLFVVIIFVILFAVSLQISKITKTGVEVSDSLVESATEDVSTLLEEETEEVEFAETSHTQRKSSISVTDEDIDETEDKDVIDDESGIFAISEANDDGVSAVDDDSDNYMFVLDAYYYLQSTSDITEYEVCLDTGFVEYEHTSDSTPYLLIGSDELSLSRLLSEWTSNC